MYDFTFFTMPQGIIRYKDTKKRRKERSLLFFLDNIIFLRKGGFYYEFVRTYSQIYCLIFLLILKSHPHTLEVDNKFPVRH